MAGGLVVVVFAIVRYALVRTRRKASEEWNASGHAGFANATEETFADVWLLRMVPRSVFLDNGEGIRGTLSTVPSAGKATFRASDGNVMDLRNVSAVTMGHRGRGHVSTWIDVEIVSGGVHSTVHLIDRGWFGCRALLTSSNQRIADALRTLVPESSAMSAGR